MKVGSLVECVKIANKPDYSDLEQFTINKCKQAGYVFPVYGGTYTISGFSKTGDGLFLEECVNPVLHPEGFEVAFDIQNFRELQPPMDISELIEECQTQTFSI